MKVLRVKSTITSALLKPSVGGNHVNPDLDNLWLQLEQACAPLPTLFMQLALPPAAVAELQETLHRALEEFLLIGDAQRSTHFKARQQNESLRMPHRNH